MPVYAPSGAVGGTMIGGCTTPGTSDANTRGGGAMPGGGGGMYLPTVANTRPTNNSGGQVENAIVPPGFSTRSISRTATSGRGANM